MSDNFFLCWLIAHITCSFTSSDLSFFLDFNALKTSSLVFAFPNATAMFLNQSSYPILLIADPSVFIFHNSSFHKKTSTRSMESRFDLGLKSSIEVFCANLFHGQNIWQSSQPNILFPIASLYSIGIGPFSSIVR